jgi:hypothetical protein
MKDCEASPMRSHLSSPDIRPLENLKNMRTIDSFAVAKYLDANSPLKRMDFTNNYIN